MTILVKNKDTLSYDYFSFKCSIGTKGKSKNKLDPLDILNKEKSLRGVLEPYTIKANIDFMKRAGFKDITPILQYINFIGFLAIK